MAHSLAGSRRLLLKSLPPIWIQGNYRLVSVTGWFGGNAGGVGHSMKMIRFRVILLLALFAGCLVLPASAAADGVPDRSFGGDGRITFDPRPGANDTPDDVAIDSKGRIVVVGNSVNMTDSRGYVARFLSDGSPDLSFDGDGIVIYSPKTTLNAVAIDSQDRITTAGTDSSGVTSFDFLATRLLANGASDVS